eukprot:TRINITY_DN1394_c0_g1_i1.p1 TRINITY_DN1394_c0_g1~~TRINITY_DN1394_c0_g1_i1.p1  ORF type:complete len:160 (-),score=51.69 TRINITY_DN1394_c0_g1_i1:60-482(-)
MMLLLFVLVWVLSLMCVSALIFFAVVALISYSDLESDYINPIEMSKRLNAFVKPEWVVFGVMLAPFVLGLFLPEIIINLPLLLWFVHSYVKGEYKHNPTTAFRDLGYRRIVAFCKLGFFMLSFFFYLYRMVYFLVQDYIA